MKICKKFEFPAIKNWDKYSHLLEKKISWFSLISIANYTIANIWYMEPFLKHEAGLVP